MLTQEEIAQQQELLRIYRTNLTYALMQAAQHGGELSAPLPTINTLREARDHIQRIKKILRTNGVVVDDHPDDVPPIRRELDKAVGKHAQDELLQDKANSKELLARREARVPGAQIDRKGRDSFLTTPPGILIGIAVLVIVIVGSVVVLRPPTSLMLSPTPQTISDEMAAKATVESFSVNGQIRKEEVKLQPALYDKQFGWMHISTEVSAVDFSVSARMYVPEIPNGIWRYGFDFGGGCKFFIEYQGKWTLQCDELIAEGEYNGLSTIKETYNDLSLTILNSTVFIFINNTHITTESIPMDVTTANEIFIGWQLSERATPLNSPIPVYYENLRVIVKNP
jgi:hypothetical protein